MNEADNDYPSSCSSLFCDMHGLRDADMWTKKFEKDLPEVTMYR